MLPRVRLRMRIRVGAINVTGIGTCSPAALCGKGMAVARAQRLRPDQHGAACAAAYSWPPWRRAAHAPGNEGARQQPWLAPVTHLPTWAEHQSGTAGGALLMCG